MNQPPPFTRWLAGMALSLALASAGANAAEPGPPPARIDHPVKESQLATLTLTPEAERRLGIVTVPAERRNLARSRFLGGEIALPAGTGHGGRQSVFAILPTLAPAEQVRLAQAQIEADGQVEQAQVQLDATRQALRRAEQMLRDKVGTERAVDDARAQVGLAEVGVQTAQARRGLLGPALLAATLPAEVWVRVPVYVGDLPKLDTQAEAQVGGLADPPGTAGRRATPVAAPPSANPAAASVDLFYRLPNRDGVFRPGQKVGVTVPWRDAGPALAVPWSAVVHDSDGGAWVYERTAPSRYTRRRVRIERVVDDWAAVAGGIQAGAEIVTVGAAELLGTEFGVGK